MRMLVTQQAIQKSFTRMEDILVLRRQGASYKTIGDRIGVSEHRAATLVSKAIKRVLKEPAEDVRALELSRLETLIGKLWTPAIDELDKADPDFRKFDRLKSLIETKLRWCGAQEVILNQNDNRVQIIVQSFQKSIPKEITQTPPEEISNVE